jgi:hypothetical protein
MGVVFSKNSGSLNQQFQIVSSLKVLENPGAKNQQFQNPNPDGY